MIKPFSRRFAIAPLFIFGVCWSYFTAGGATPAIPRMKAIASEEGQLVCFDKATFQQRELAKRLPLDEKWPAGEQLQKSLERYGLIQNAPENRFSLVPAQIAEGVYLVGQDRNSNLSYMIDCGQSGVAVIDPSFESEFERTLANVEKCGRSRKEIRWLLNTHCHVDHSMADQKFRELGAEILIHDADADAIEKGTRVTAYFNGGIKEFPRCKVDRRLSDGEELRLGNRVVHVIHTPGHTPGSASFLLQTGGKNLLFSGDTVFYDYRLGWQGPYAENRELLYSIEKLERFTMGWSGHLQWDVLLPGHGAIALDRAYLDVKKAKEAVAADLAVGVEVIGMPYAKPQYRALMYGRPALQWR